MQPPQSCPPLGDGAKPPARVSRARPRASRPRAPVPARGRGAPRPTASRDLPLSPLHASWVSCDKPPIRCVVTYQGDAPNPRRENYRATDFPAAPGTPAAARLCRSPPLRSNYCFLTGCNYCEMQTLRTAAVTRQAQAALTPAAHRRLCPPPLKLEPVEPSPPGPGGMRRGPPAGTVFHRRAHHREQPRFSPPLNHSQPPAARPPRDGHPATAASPKRCFTGSRLPPSLIGIPTGCGRRPPPPSSGLPPPSLTRSIFPACTQ